MARHQLVIISLLILQATAVIRVPLRREVLSMEVNADMDLQEQGLDVESILKELEKEETVAGVSNMAELGEMHPDNPPASPFKMYILHHKENLYGLISIGTPQQVFKVKLSTAMAGLQIPSAHCSHKGHACRTHRKYDSSQSSTYVSNGTEISVQIGNATVKAIVSQDVVHLAGVKVPDQHFTEVVDEPLVMAPYIDGVLGLAYPSLSHFGILPVFDHIMDLKLLPLNIISHYFNSLTGMGELMLGGTNENHYKGELHYVPVAHKLNWQIAVDGIALGEDLHLCADGCKAALHTCGKGIFGPAHDIHALHAAIGAKPVGQYGMHVVPCLGISLLPKMSFNLGGQEFVLSPFDYIKRLEFSPKEMPMNQRHKKHKHLCVTSFHAHDHSQHGEEWILGETFLHRFYTVFDRDQDRVGFAPVKWSHLGPMPDLQPASATDNLPEAPLGV